MNITILTYGSRGDVQPYVALGRGLQQAGYSVRLAAPETFADFVTGYGLDFAPLAGDPTQLSAQLVDAAGLNPLRNMQAVFDYALPLGVRVLEGCRAACQDADAVVYGFLLTVAAHEIALELGIPEIFAQMYPMFVPTGDFPALMFPRSPFLTASANQLTHRVFTSLFRANNTVGYRIVQRHYPDLPPLKGDWPFDRTNPPLALFGYSPHVIPRPADWPGHAHVTGFWEVIKGADWQPPDDLVAFLAEGPPPVYIGFGSVVSDAMDTLTGIVLDALAQTGQRAILLGGWGGLGRADLPDSILRIDAAPHDWLFPRMAAVVHHGGVGTTAAGLRASVPSVLVPFAADQLFWGQKVVGLGVGPAPLPRRTLSPDRLAYAIRVAATHAPMRQRAAALGESLRAEDGVGTAVGLIKAYLSNP